MKKNSFIIFYILFVAAAVKWAYYLSSRGLPFFEPILLDPRYYHDWAIRLTRQQWDQNVFYGLPLYPYFMAVVYAVTNASIHAVKIAQIALGLVTIFFIYKTGEKISDRRAGILAALLASVYGPLFFHEQIFIPEALALPLYAAALYVACLLWERVTFRKAVVLGVLAGLAALTKAGVLLFVPVFAVMLVLKNKASQGRKSAWWVLVACLLTIAPIPLHNYFRGHDRVFLTSHAGFNFYIGNNSKAEGVFKAPEGTGTNVDAQIEDSRTIAETALGRALKPSEVSAYWADKAWQFIRKEPIGFLWLCKQKALLFFDAREISDVDDYQFAARLNDFVGYPWPNFYWLGPLLFAGLFSIFKRSKFSAVVYTWIGVYLLGMISFFVNARYRLPLLPIFIPLAATALVDFYDSVRQMRTARVTLLVCFAVLGAWVGRLELVSPDFTRDYVNAGDALVEKKDFDGAKGYYLEAIKMDPRHAKANLAMGLLMTRQGLYDEAKRYYDRSIETNPENSQAQNNLGLWYDRAGDLAKAEECFLKALALKPNSSQAHNNLGMVYGKRGQYEKAAREFEASIKINPDSARAQANLGLVYYRLGQIQPAVDAWHRALEIDPMMEEARRALQLLERDPLAF